jgi:hypothetical protein
MKYRSLKIPQLSSEFGDIRSSINGFTNYRSLTKIDSHQIVNSIEYNYQSGSTAPFSILPSPLPTQEWSLKMLHLEHSVLAILT